LSAHYFISDAHIGTGLTDAERRLGRFLDSIRGRADSLYVLGDLFEFWFEYRRAIPKHGFRILSQLAELRRRGTGLFYLKGNHDFWFKDFLKRELGTEAADELDSRIDGRRVYLAHGDVLDRGFVPRASRTLMRSRLNGMFYSLVHPDLGIGLAQRVASKSRGLGAKLYLTEAMARFARGKIQAGFDIVIMGHSHVPEQRRFGGGVYVNVGDWMSNFTYGVIADGVPSLCVFEEKTR
jgi:UDP-2,3-diacylglucosamine hydrolase